MPRNKLKLAFITDDSARIACFQKRKKSLMKKLNELSTLCGIDGCAIMYSPYASQPEVWPNDDGVQQMLAQFRSMSVIEQSKKMVNQEDYLRKRINKANEQLKKQTKENQEKKMTQVMYQCLTGKESLANLNMTGLNYLGSLVDKNLSEIDSRIETLKEVATAPPPPQSQPPQSLAVVGDSNTTNHMMAGGVAVHGNAPVVDNPGAGAVDGMQSTNWFTDWIDNLGEHDLGLGQGDDMRMLFADDPNPMWSSAFFPKTI